MRNLKKSFLPLGIMVVGAVAAFASHGNGSKAALMADETGYVTVDAATPCDIEIACSTTGNVLCTAMVDGIQYHAYGKWSVTDVSCEKQLFRR